jgi:hypothetical protein
MGIQCGKSGSDRALGLKSLGLSCNSSVTIASMFDFITCCLILRFICARAEISR